MPPIIAIRGISNKIKIFFLGNKTELLISILISAFYITLMLTYTHGALFFGGDSPGYYNVHDINFSSKTTIIYSFFIAASFGNFYVGDYAAAFFIMFLILFFLGKVTKEIVQGLIPSQYLNLVSGISQFLYVIGPLSITESIYSFAGNQISFDTVFVLIFLLGLMIGYKSLLRYDKIGAKALLFMAIGMAGSLPIFPNSIRLFIVNFLIFVFFFIIVSIYKIKEKQIFLLRYFIEFITVTIILFAVSLYRFLPLFMNITFYSSVASSAASNNAYIGFYTGSFNSLPFSLRLFGSWLFPHTPYYGLYSTLNLVNILSFLWPVFALVVPILLIGRNRIPALAPFILFLAVAFFWYDAGNIPLGFLWWAIVHHLPETYQLIPPGEITIQLGIVYYIMAALGIVLFVLFLEKNIFKGYRKNKKILFGIATMVILVLLLFSMYPVVNGNAETLVYNSPTNVTYFVPTEYSYARQYLLAEHAENILVLPATYTYMSTKWRYDGIALFYQEYFAPIGIINEFTFGGEYISPGNLSLYNNLTLPTILTGENYSISPEFINLIEKYHINYILFDSTLSVSNSTMGYYQNSLNLLLKSNIIVDVLNLSPLYIYKVN